MQYRPDKSGWHQYQSGPNVVCPADVQCSKEEIADQLARYSVPGHDPSKPVESGKSYAVYDPQTGLPGGLVTTTISEDGLTITNTTLPLHVFYDGVVTRAARQSGDGSWTVTTEGRGNNVLPGASEVNQIRGPDIFKTLDQRMRANIERHHIKAFVVAPAGADNRHFGRIDWPGVGGQARAEY